MYLRDFFDYKNRLAEDLMTHENIVKLLNKDLTLDNAEQLMYRQIFPYEYVPETIENAQTFICFDVDLKRSVSKTFYNPVLYIWVFTHKSMQRLPDGGLTVDSLCSAIAEAIDGSRFYGLGTLELYSVSRFAPQTAYLGKVMTFNMTEFKRLSPTGKEVPNNRKL